MISRFIQAARMLLIMTLLTGVAYPLAVTAVARLAFFDRAGGSLIEENGRVIGSELIGQPFDDPRYFFGRPSATVPAYNAAASSGSNYGVGHPDLRKMVEATLALHLTLTASVGARAPGPVPIDLVTRSGSGLDPDISPAAALWQVARVAMARKIPENEVRALVESRIEGRTLGFLGEPRVNVVGLNRALDRLR